MGNQYQKERYVVLYLYFPFSRTTDTTGTCLLGLIKRVIFDRSYEVDSCQELQGVFLSI